MKRIFVAISALGLLFASCNQVDQYKLTGHVEGMQNGKVYLSKLQDNELVKIDSVDYTDGAFHLEGKVDQPDLYFIELQGERTPIQFFLENSKITIDANLENLRAATVVGSANQDVYNLFRDSQKSFQEKQQGLIQQYQKANQNKDQVQMDSIRNAFDKIESSKNTASKEFIKANSTSIVTGFIAYRLSMGMEASEMEKVYNLLDESVRSSKYALKIKEKMELLKKVAVGQVAPDFTLNTPEGTPLSLSSLKGKVVVIDFWASWCGPCRRENPHMVETYNKLHEKGVEFLGVSLDKNKDAWLKAISDDGLVWDHVSDLKYWNSAAAKMYGINGIPATVLIDQNGVIVAKKIFGEELKTAIEKLVQ
ncbi:TlpA disulfide reductase family protein [Ancylomarina longa]|uniref:AhpC/TSA family protein n=1 Tax=Ancylomarina longa TaxID=2487017 RepID=A0A434AVM1_9BACT|nr:TlpA disulfide reductase family protein [Ancylomarina longa]RUT78499.1 AhpC/TSA family protein [Ancylomarina longa]